ncbi:MAG TPA: hypothetical protein VEH31_37425 [Streptosporangiaceae bacterium]|nr:hypothetical protein [Streptosporangiaceae bacterium]
MGESTSGGPVSAGAEAAAGAPETARYEQDLSRSIGVLGNVFITLSGVTRASAVANALTANEDMTGRDGHRTPALPRDQVAALFRPPAANS